MKRKVVASMLICMMMTSIAEAATVETVRMKDGVWTVSGVSNDGAGEVVMSVTDAETDEFVDARQITVGKNNAFSFSLPAIKRNGKYTLRVADSLDSAPVEKTMYITDNSKSGIMYQTDFSEEIDEWQITGIGTGRVSSAKKFRLGNTSYNGKTEAILNGFYAAMDYEYQIDVSGSVYGMTTQMLFRYTDENNYCYFNIPISSSGGTGVYKTGVVKDGIDYPMSEFKVLEGEGKTAATYTVTIKCCGYWTYIYSGNRLVGKIYDKSVTNGTIGFSTINGQAVFDNIKVTNLYNTARCSKITIETVDGSTAYSIPDNGKIVIKSKVKNISSDETFKGLLISAVYDGKNLKKIISDEVAVAAGNEDEFTAEISGLSKSDTVKVFLWNDYLDIKPLNEGNEIGDETDFTNIYIDAGAVDSLKDGSFENPYTTIEEGVEALKNRKATYGLGEDGLRLWIRGGHYNISSPIVLEGAEYSGTKLQPVVISAYNGEDVRISGGSVVDTSNMVIASDSRIPAEAAGKVYVCDIDMDIPEIEKFTYTGYPNYYTNLVLDGKAQQIAKYPNEGYLNTSNMYNQNGANITPTSSELKNESALFTKWDTIRSENSYMYMNVPDSHLSRWQTAGDAWLAGYWYTYWSFENVKMLGADAANGRIKMQIPQYFFMTTNRHYFIYNLLEELDSPGEWYIDKTAKKLYFYPPEEIDENSNLEISTIDETLFSLNNVENVVVDGIKIENGAGRNVDIYLSDNIEFTGCEVRNAGTNGITVTSSTNVDINNSLVHDLGANGILIQNCGDVPKLIRAECGVNNCEIYNFGQNKRSYSPAIKFANVVGCYATNNKIHDGSHSAITFEGSEIKMEYNEIYDVLTQAADSGAIYGGRSYIMWGNTIKYNYIHNIYDEVDIGVPIVGVFLDDMLSGTTVESNIMVDVNQGIFLSGGRDTVIRNNVIVNKTADDPAPNGDGRYAIMIRTTGLLDHRQSMVQGMINNISKLDLNSEGWKKYPYVNVYPKDAPGAPVRNIVENNVIWNHLDLKSYSDYHSWSTVGKNLINTTNPGFVDAQAGDYTMRSDSDVFELLPEFEAIPFEKIGMIK